MASNNYKHWKLETDTNNILWCTLDKNNASTNVLSAEVMEEFANILSDIENNLPTGVVFASGKGSGFIAGADVTEFVNIETEEEALGIINNVHALFNRLDKLPCPTLALINGFCLGGGLEMSLACRYRVALDDPKTRIGLPEVKLGIFPGFGGTARLIRTIGAIPAMQLMLAGRTLDARRAAKMGVVDRAVPDRQLKRAAVAMILKQPTLRRPGKLQTLANANIIRSLIAKFLRRELNKKVKQEHYPSPYGLVDLWERYGNDESTMLIEEAKAVSSLIVSDVARNLVRVFLLQERMKASGDLKDYAPKHVHVIGAGVMGGDIAAWCAYRGYTVTLQDREAKYIAPAIARAHKYFKKRLRVTHLVTAAKDRLVPDVKGLGIERADIVIEAIIENADAKIALFKDLESRVKDDAVLATNTSSIPLGDISQQLNDPERLVGIHFFNPVAQMQLVEIVYDEKTSQDWIKKASTFCRQIDRFPLQVKSSPGFLVNRILTPYLLETVKLIEEGVPAPVIDKIAEDFGMPMGPVELADTVGLDICLSVAENLAGTLTITIPDKLRQMVERGDLGKKSGKGFYKYKKGKAIKTSDGQGQTPHDLEDRLVLRILNECAACLRENLVEDADLLDAGMIYGTGFAPFRGGPMHYAEVLGKDTLVKCLADLQQQYGERFKPDESW
jgi:3-hydroxyacyl-CoA dehydrogenase/enoyl-CoA hydratase/3-hydroxybutyryl-CoA epimerase